MLAKRCLHILKVSVMINKHRRVIKFLNKASDNTFLNAPIQGSVIKF